MNKHITTIHARCPHAPVWDYYTVTLETEDCLLCEKFERYCDGQRGVEATQEEIFYRLSVRIPATGTLTVEGRHGQNGQLIVSGPLTRPPFPGRSQ